jgi:uncharacterized lipoprotein
VTDNVEALARDWLEAKRAEAEAAQRRYAIEAQMCEALEVPAEGSKTHKLDGYKVTVTQPVTRKLDEAVWDQVRNNCPPDMQPIKIRIEADATGCKYLANHEPEIWRKIARAFETKPGKVGFKVEAL